MAKKVLKFWAPWCGPCSQYAPTFEKVKQELVGETIFQEVNVDEDGEGLTAEYKIKGIPCTVILQNGVEVARQAGALTEDQLREFILVN
jgi:thioredoxin 2